MATFEELRNKIADELRVAAQDLPIGDRATAFENVLLVGEDGNMVNFRLTWLPAIKHGAGRFVVKFGRSV